MTNQDHQEEFNATLQPFCEKHGLMCIWRTDLLLFMDPRGGSDSAHVCVSFDPCYWESYADSEPFQREYLRNKLKKQLDACGSELHNLGHRELFALHAT